MRKLHSVMLVLISVAPIATASASASGVVKPSEAPPVTVGQHYFGNAGCSECVGGQLWHLPPLLTSDIVSIAWNSTAGRYPELCLAQDIDDYNWGENSCNGSERSSVSGTGSARTAIQAKTATLAPFLEFIGECCYISLPYDFTVESIQHAVGMGLTPMARIKPTSTLRGSANLSNGTPVPDGLVFTLTATWATPTNRASHQRIYAASSLAGGLAFPLNLPISAQGKDVSFTVSRPADPQYLSTSSSTVKILVARVNRHRHHRRCRRGFRRRRVHGRIRCVRQHRHGHHRMRQRARLHSITASG
jgi:hypothetical protein